MTLWLIAGLVALLVALWLGRPFFRRGQIEANEAEYAISIYRDQQDELQRDCDEGRISEAERDAAEREIERRTLRAARNLDTSPSIGRPAPLLAALAALFVLAGSIGLYAWLGTPTAEDQPHAARQAEMRERLAQAGDLESQAQILAARVEENPDSFEGWWMLARSYAAMGDHAMAAGAYRQAARLRDDDPAVLSAYAEAMTLANGNKVPMAARLVFAQVQQKTNDPRARYYLALAKAQAQDFEGALTGWVSLLQDSTADAPWVPLVRRDIVNMVRFVEGDLLAVLPDATPAERAKAGQNPTPTAAATTDPSAEIAALKASLTETPKNWEASIQLAKLEAAQGTPEAAQATLEEAKRLYAGAPFVLAKLDEAGAELGLGAGDDATRRRGPSDADVAAASQMSEHERDAMVRGMVDGLATRLKAQPDDLEGWLMLIRSYAVLQLVPEAEGAVQDAKLAFQGNVEDLQEIERLALTLGIPQS